MCLQIIIIFSQIAVGAYFLGLLAVVVIVVGFGIVVVGILYTTCI